MSLLKRIAFYLGGFAIGLILLYFFVAGSGASCEYDYGPNARTLKNIRNKERIFSPETLNFLKQEQLDTSSISNLLRYGNVLFSESNTKLDSCKIYKIEGDVSVNPGSDLSKNLLITVENCENKAAILNASFE